MLVILELLYIFLHARAGCRLHHGAEAQAHYEIVMVEEEQPAQPALPVSEFQMLQEKQGYNLQLLEQHRLSEG